MQVWGVSRVLNEADMIEPFVRHHAALLDGHILLDGGSSDETVAVLRALREEGLNLQVYQTGSPVFVEQVLNTGLYRLALAEGADWVLFLDADELLAVRGAERPQEVLALVPGSVPALCLQVYRYAVPAPGDAHPLTRLRHRDPAPEMPKVTMRRLHPERVSIYAGNHGAWIDGQQEPGLSQDRLWLAHLPERSPLQAARKAILARMKVAASGAESAGQFSTHLVSVFEELRTDPRGWMARTEAARLDGTVEDEVPYRGGALRYTGPPDELARLLALFAAEGERLARSHGAILDRKRLIRRDLLEKGAVVRRLL
jgi:hypothetical protein